MRPIIIVLDSLGIGEMPDANNYGDYNVDTLGHILAYRPELKIPNLYKLGIGNLTPYASYNGEVVGNYGKMAEVSKGKDTTTGHWEIAGLKTDIPFKTYPDGFPKEFIEEFQRRIGIEVIGNYPASGTEIIKELGPEHEATGKPIVYTSADSVFQIAMNVELFGLDTLYHYCEVAREMLVGDWACCRVIARPYITEDELNPLNGEVTTKRIRTSDRKDYSVSPHGETVLDKIVNGGHKVYAVGKINDIFNGCGISESVHIDSNMDGVDKTILAIQTQPNDCLIFTNLVDFDAKFGHRRDVDGYANAIEEFDLRLPEIIESLRDDDVLFIVADHGNDPTAYGTDHTREYVPVLVYGKKIRKGINLGTMDTFADVAATISEMMSVEDTGLGNSFLDEIKEDENSDTIEEYEYIDDVPEEKDTRFSMIDLIQKKRDGEVLTKDEIDWWIKEYTNDNIPDYQVSALLMAIYLNGLVNEEVFNLTDAMRRSGAQMDLSAIDGIKVDKHSSGGVGDKTTLAVAPIVAACGVPVAKMSGRGLGFTGGTIDKLESIPGFKTSLTPEEFVNQVNSVGIAVVGQTANIAPADKKLYALRDVTGTVNNFGLIASSIMSKKLAAGSDAIVLDVKCGEGAFMKNEEDATHLAKIMVHIGHTAGKPTVAMITSMDQPLGNAVGNSLEVYEAIETLKGHGPEDFTELVKRVAGVMLYLGGVANSEDDGYQMAENVIESGAALEKFREFVAAQGGDPNVVDDYSLLPKAKYIAQIAAHKAGFISEINAETVGVASQRAGAGRLEKGETIDLSAGVYFNRKVRDWVEESEVICTICGDDENKVANAAQILKTAIKIADDCPEWTPIVKNIIGF